NILDTTSLILEYEFELMMQYTVLPFVAVFYNQYYCEFFCGCTNLRYIETKTFWLIFHQCIEHGLLLLFLKLRERILCRHYRMDFLYKSRKSTRLNSSHVSISYDVFCL